MALEQSNIIDPYVPWTGWGDYAFNDDVNAITEYIENQRPQIKKYPDLQSVIEEYEHWLTNLSWSEKYLTPDTSKGKAVYYRDKVNEILRRTIDPTIVPGDISHKIVSVDPNTSPSFITSFFTQFIPESLLKTFKITGFLVIGGIIIYYFGPLIRAGGLVIHRKMKAQAPQLSPSPNDIIKETKP